MFKIDHTFLLQSRYKNGMPAPDLSLNFNCPICGAAPQEKCELNSGTPRFQSHVERLDIAKDHISTLNRGEQRSANPL
jgi:hypothetical protein